MKAARILVLVVALAAGGVAALLAGRSNEPAPVKKAAPAITTVEVLVAKSDIPTGNKISPQDVEWQAWPASASTGNFIRKKNRPDAIEKMSGMIARSSFVAGEPIREAKLVNAEGSGYMAAILPTGMRAISTQISPETGAGGFILPNDHVDVILTRRERDADGGGDKQTSETILRNVRVLAIDQTVQEKNGQKVVVGKTATLELTPQQAESLTLAQHLGSLSLALRSITDARNDTPVKEQKGPPGSVNIIRFGVSTSNTVR